MARGSAGGWAAGLVSRPRPATEGLEGDLLRMRGS